MRCLIAVGSSMYEDPYLWSRSLQLRVHTHTHTLTHRLKRDYVRWGNTVLCRDWTVSEHQKMCEERLAPLLTPSETLSDEDASKLGKKDPEQEVGHVRLSSWELQP